MASSDLLCVCALSVLQRAGVNLLMCCPQDQQLSSLLDVARGMQYLHDSNMLHGDLKAGNVCLLKCPTSASSWLNATGRSNTSPANNFTCKVWSAAVTAVVPSATSILTPKCTALVM